MNSKKYKELKITYTYLSGCGLNVPRELLLELSRRIMAEEKRRSQKRMENMSDEELALRDQRQGHSVCVTIDGDWYFHTKRNYTTLVAVLQHIGLPKVHALGLLVGRQPLVHHDPTLQRRLRAGYKLVCPGFFVYNVSAANKIVQVLEQIDQLLHLNMEIELK